MLHVACWCTQMQQYVCMQSSTSYLSAYSGWFFCAKPPPCCLTGEKRTCSRSVGVSRLFGLGGAGAVVCSCPCRPLRLVCVRWGSRARFGVYTPCSACDEPQHMASAPRAHAITHPIPFAPQLLHCPPFSVCARACLCLCVHAGKGMAAQGWQDADRRYLLSPSQAARLNPGGSTPVPSMGVHPNDDL
jgi:hypothetical protein